MGCSAVFSSVCYDEFITAPVLIAAIREVPPDDDGNLPAPVDVKKQLLEHLRLNCVSL